MGDSPVSFIKKASFPLEPIGTGYRGKQLDFSPKVVVFDIYGTMLISSAGDIGHDSAASDEKCFQDALGDAGLHWSRGEEKLAGVDFVSQEIDKAQGQKREGGILYPEIDIFKIWEAAFATMGIAAQPHQVITAIVSYECRTNPVWPMPGLMETLEALRSREVLLGIISNAQFYTSYTIQALLGKTPEELGFQAEFCIWSFLEGEGKPSPALFVKLQQRLLKAGIYPQEVLYVGNDILKDIMPASSVGWKTALFAGDKRSLRLRREDQRVAGVQADYVIDDLRQLLFP